MEGARLGNQLFDLGSQFHHSFFMGDLNYRVDLGSVRGYEHLVADKGLQWCSTQLSLAPCARGFSQHLRSRIESIACPCAIAWPRTLLGLAPLLSLASLLSLAPSWGYIVFLSGVAI
jgi:hypothetical protein